MTVLSQGAEFAGYRIDGIAGQGGMGVVYRATQTRLSRTVALKVITPDLASQGDFRERFERESRLAASIDHPNVLPVYEAGEADGRLFIAMRFVEGTDLAALIEREGALDPARGARIVAQIGSALDAAHRRGLVHRDVKPANVLVTGEDEEHAYLADFGVSKSSQSGQALTRTGAVIGTLSYIAPELIQGGSAGPSSDIYALGCLLFHTVTGTRPFERESEAAVMFAHLNEEPPLASALNPAAAPLDDVIRWAMAKDPAQRPASAGELGRAAVAAVGPGAAPVGELTRPSPLRPAPDTKPGTGDDGGAGRGRGLRIALISVLVIGVAAAALAVLGVFGGGGDDTKKAGTTTPAKGPEPVARVLATIKVGDVPDGVATNRGTVFVTNVNDGTMSRIDALGERVLGEPLQVGTQPRGVVAGKGVVWVAARGDNQVVRFDTSSDPPVQSGTIQVKASPQALSIGRQLIWVANTGNASVSRVDRASPTILGEPVAVGGAPTALFVGRASVWVTSHRENTLTRIDAATAEPVGRPIPVGIKPDGVVEAAGSVWVTNSGDDTVTRLVAATGKPQGAAIPVGHNPQGITKGFGSIWVVNGDDNSVTRLDEHTGRVVGRPIPVGADPRGIAVGPRAVWVSNSHDDTVSKIDPGAS
jgi:DNA-binding beta-propeller fold protein YncE/predicted Ser/Thr protein kinase